MIAKRRVLGQEIDVRIKVCWDLRARVYVARGSYATSRGRVAVKYESWRVWQIKMSTLDSRR